MNRWSTAVLPFALLFATACSVTRAGSPFEASVEGDRTIRIEVRNFNFADATLYARRGSERIRMGVVTGKTDQTFNIPWSVSLPLQVEINLLAGDRCITRPRSVEPGEVILVQIQINMANDPDCI
jgi:hypothetical protein